MLELRVQFNGKSIFAFESNGIHCVYCQLLADDCRWKNSEQSLRLSHTDGPSKMYTVFWHFPKHIFPFVNFFALIQSLRIAQRAHARHHDIAIVLLIFASKFLQ